MDGRLTGGTSAAARLSRSGWGYGDAVIGGSAVGLAAALQLSRQRRQVVVVDDGTPRNAPAAHMHGYLGHEGLPSAGLVALGARGGALLRR